MDDATHRMIAEAYDETVQESLSQGHNSGIAHREGVTAAAIFHASLAAVADATARAEVAQMGLEPQH